MKVAPCLSTLLERSGQGDPSEISDHGTLDLPDLIPTLPSSPAPLQVCGHSSQVLQGILSSLLPLSGNVFLRDPRGIDAPQFTMGLWLIHPL